MKSKPTDPLQNTPAAVDTGTLAAHTPCTCHMSRAGEGDSIEFCPLHSAAPALLKALKWWLAYQDDVGLLTHSGDHKPIECGVCESRVAIAKAEGSHA